MKISQKMIIFGILLASCCKIRATKINLDIGDPVGVSKYPAPRLRTSYDYIVVGAGSAGKIRFAHYL